MIIIFREKGASALAGRTGIWSVGFCGKEENRRTRRKSLGPRREKTNLTHPYSPIFVGLKAKQNM